MREPIWSLGSAPKPKRLRESGIPTSCKSTISGKQTGTRSSLWNYWKGAAWASALAANPSLRQAAELVMILARAVHVAHEAGIVHRDLKPSNVLYAFDGVPKVTDFGLAKRIDSDPGHTESGQIMGSPSYMARNRLKGIPERRAGC